MTRAAVSANTADAPLSFSTCAHASKVAPVVLTSSISNYVLSANFIGTKPITTCRERPCNVRLAAVGGELNLRPCLATPDEGTDNRRSQMTRDLPRLIEAPLMLAPPMQWDGDDAIGAPQDVIAANAHLCGERLRK